MLQGVGSVQDTLAAIEGALGERRAAQVRLGEEVDALEAAAAALRKIVPAPATGRITSRPPVDAPVRLPAGPVTATVAAAWQAPVADDLRGQYPEVRARRQRVLQALPLKGDIRCAELARHLDLAQSHVQTDLEKLLEQGLAERVAWGRWKRATEEVVVFSGRDSLLPPTEASAQP